jgi:hypothetical protein
MLLYLARESLPGVFTAVMSFPFEQLGLGLRKLSLSGRIGNVFSIVLYCVISLSPAVALLLLKRRRRLYFEDSLLAVLSALLLAVLYLMVNPGMMGTYLGSAAGQSVGKALLGGMAYSVLIGYVLLRILRVFFTADTNRLQKYLTVLLCVLNILFVYLAFGANSGDLMDSFEALRAGNTGNEQSLGMSYLFLVLQYLVNTLPYVLDILVVFAGQNLLKELTSDRYSEAALIAAEKLSYLCRLALVITVISNISFNLLQLIFIKTLSAVNGSVQIPLMSIAFVLAALLLSQYIRENKQLKDDNDMFI